jgi:hypothetical protein
MKLINDKVMKTKHTPGPWSYTDTEEKGFFEIEAPKFDTTTELATVRPSDPYVHSEERAEANAQLMAAAPVMLHELEAAKLTIKSLGEQLLKHNIIPADQYHMRIKLIDAAIKKATL